MSDINIYAVIRGSFWHLRNPWFYGTYLHFHALSSLLRIFLPGCSGRRGRRFKSCRFDAGNPWNSTFQGFPFFIDSSIFLCSKIFLINFTPFSCYYFYFFENLIPLWTPFSPTGSGQKRSSPLSFRSGHTFFNLSFQLFPHGPTS